MDLIWLLVIWALIGLFGALRKPPRGRRLSPPPDPEPDERPKRRGRPVKRQEAEAKSAAEEDEEEEEWPPPEPSPYDKRTGRAGVTSGATLRMDSKTILNGIVMREVLSKPRGLRPWKPWGQRYN